MGLDMRPMGKPKPGFEKRFAEIFQMISTNNFPKPSLWDKLSGKKTPSRDDLLKEWFANQIQTYETIKAPKVGRDLEADQWLKENYDALDEKPSFAEFKKTYLWFYVIPLAKEQDGVPCYVSFGQDENVFRGQFLTDCVDLIGEELVAEAWETKLAEETLDYGKRLMTKADSIAEEKHLKHLKSQVSPPETDPESLESKLHIVYSLARWLIFYGKNGHGYEADY